MHPMRVFLDTEFTDFHYPRLISLGCYTQAAGGQTFYAEIERAAWYDWRSEFVHSEIVPLLSRNGEAGESRAAIAKRFRLWCAKFIDDEILIVVDFTTDWDLLEKLLLETGPWPANLRRAPDVFDPWLMDRDKGWGCVRAREAYYKKYGMSAHHALNDARALSAAWLHAEMKKGGSK